MSQLLAEIHNFSAAYAAENKNNTHPPDTKEMGFFL
jgi:hypothetical protein